MNGRRMMSPTFGEDTVELELTPEELLGLSEAAESAAVAASAPISVEGTGPISHAFLAPRPLLWDTPAIRPSHWHQTPITKMVVSTVAFVAFAWWSGSQLAGQPQPTAAATVRPIVVSPRPALLTDTPKPLVQVINPFDATEVFEFPAGTSDVESREKVAQILLQRARERQTRWERIKSRLNIRTASVYR